MIRLNIKYLGFGIIVIILVASSVSLILPSEFITDVQSLEASNISLLINYGNGKKSKFTIDAGTVFDALNKTCNIEYKYYKGLGYFITSIDGVTQNKTHSWGYFVNNKFAMVSANNYVLKNNDNITWVLMNNEEFGKYFFIPKP